MAFTLCLNKPQSEHRHSNDVDDAGTDRKRRRSQSKDEEDESHDHDEQGGGEVGLPVWCLVNAGLPVPLHRPCPVETVGDPGTM